MACKKELGQSGLIYGSNRQPKKAGIFKAFSSQLSFGVHGMLVVILCDSEFCHNPSNTKHSVIATLDAGKNPDRKKTTFTLIG